MSKKPFRSQASSSRAFSGAFGAQDGAFGGTGFGTPSGLGAVSSSALSYVYEPPDLSGISDPNMVVAFKNVQKKDGTTKAKALEDLQTQVVALDMERVGIEESALEAWIKLYPRISIDNSRRVRQLAHTLHGQISVSYGKRMGKSMPKIVGAWLCGLYDNDKLVTRAARDSFSQVFPNEEKQQNVWKLCQSSILEYCRDAIFKESTRTLSDERTTSPDDAEAKYARVVGSAISVVTQTLESLAAEELDKQAGLYQDILKEPRLWKLSSHSNAFVRRSVYRLLSVVLFRNKDAYIDLTIISTHVLVGSLNVDQTASSYEFVKSLAELSSKHPQVWTTSYPGSGKKSAVRRLSQFLSKGSQSGPPIFWVQLSQLLRTVLSLDLQLEQKPTGDKPISDETSSHLVLLEALHDGITHKSENRSGQNEAWRAYLQVAELAQRSNSTPNQESKFIESSLAPIIEQYVKPLPERNDWTVAGSDQQRVCLGSIHLIQHGSLETLNEVWQRLSKMIIEDLQISSPEQSKDYIKSQDAIVAEIKRWYSLQAAIVNSEKAGAIRPVLISACLEELKSAINVITARSGKPYSAAVALLSMIQLLPDITLNQPEARKILMEFAKNKVPSLLLTPSSQYLIGLLDRLSTDEELQDSSQKAINSLLNAPESDAKSKALQTLVGSPWLERDVTSTALAGVVNNNLRQALEGKDDCWDLVNEAMKNPDLPSALADNMLSTLTNGLSIENSPEVALHGLTLAVRHNRRGLKGFSTSKQGPVLLSRLLFLAESSQRNVAHNARDLNTSIQAIISSDENSNTAHRSMIEIINKGLDTAERNSLSIESLLEQADKILRATVEDQASSISSELLPDDRQWAAALKPFITRTPNISLAITNGLGGAIYTINQKSPSSGSIPNAVSYDADGFSSALRTAWYTTKLINSTKVFHHLAEGRRAALFRYLSVFVQLSGDNLSIPHVGGLWMQDSPDTESAIINLIAEIQTLSVTWLSNSSVPGPSFVDSGLEELFEESKGLTTAAYYSGRAYAALAAEMREVRGPTNTAQDEEQLRKARSTPTIIANAAYVASASESKGLLRLCNEQIANLTGLNLQERLDEALQQLILLNCIFQRQEDIVYEIPQQRVIFYVKHVVFSLRQTESPSNLKAEICRSLAFVLLQIKDIYESFWSDIINVLINVWSLDKDTSDDNLPLIHATLRLCATLRGLTTKEPNEDLLEYWTEKETVMMDGLISLVKYQASVTDETSQPRRIVNELLARQLLKFEPSHVTDSQELYPIMACESTALQHSTYEILHRIIPSRQENVSLDAALSQSYTAKLPEELLSLILAAPDLSMMTGSLRHNLSLSLRSYLLSWSLVFDHWTNASYKVRADYVDCIKEGTYLQNLLSLTFASLISGRARPVDASKFDVESYTVGMQDSPDRDIQWLLIHLYYLSLKHVPALSKSWWRDDSSRSLQRPVESWTEKFISPYVIQAELSTVATWISTQDSEDQILEVKVSPKAREIIASYPIDDQTMSITIRLPATYPLHSVSVEGLHRVGIDEKKWRSWLITVQGVINFSSTSGSIIDGLVAWRKNVTGALKGQSECAICYSVVSADKQLPTKRCTVCKNLFHGSCLFRWFKSSNSSSCPLCRNAFNF